MAKSFAEKNQGLLIASGVVLVAYYLVSSGIIVLPTGSVEVNANVPQEEQPGSVYFPVVERADLRLIAQPYLAATDADELCILYGFEWRFEPDYVGCIGAGTTDCSTPIILAAQTQCIGVHADWVCNLTEISCRYG